MGTKRTEDVFSGASVAGARIEVLPYRVYGRKEEVWVITQELLGAVTMVTIKLHCDTSRSMSEATTVWPL